MIKKEISSQIVTVAPDYVRTLGGISHVVEMYSTIFEEFNYVASTLDGTIFARLCKTACGLVYYLRFLMKSEVKIVHVHGATRGSFWRKSIFIYLAKLFRKKVIYHIHGGHFDTYYNQHPCAVAYTVSKCDRLIVLSRSWKCFFDEVTYSKQVTIVNNIIPNPTSMEVCKDESVCTFLFFGKLMKAKGIYDLLEVLNNNQELYRGKMQLMVGGNGEVENFQSLIKKYGIEDMVHYLGWVIGEDKVKALHKSDVYILPSYTEGLPISILEAMSYKLPIISTNVGGIPEIVDSRNGFLISPGDKLALKECIDQLIASKELRVKMGEESFELSKAYFPEKVEKALTSIYVEVLKKQN